MLLIRQYFICTCCTCLHIDALGVCVPAFVGKLMTGAGTQTPNVENHMGPLSVKILSLEMDLSSLITLTTITIVFSMLKITRLSRLKIY